MKYSLLSVLIFFLVSSCTGYPDYRFGQVYALGEEYRQEELSQIRSYDDLHGTFWLMALDDDCRDNKTITTGLLFLNDDMVLVMSFFAVYEKSPIEINSLWNYSYFLQRPEFTARYEIKDNKLVFLNNLVCYLDKKNNALYFNGDSEDINVFKKYIFFSKFSEFL